MSFKLAVILVLLSISACHRAGDAPRNDTTRKEGGQSLAKKLSSMESGYSSSVADWSALLDCWGAQFGGNRAQNAGPVDVVALPDLPTSYRHFVQATGGQGWQLPGARARSGHGHVQFFPSMKVGLFRKVDPTTWKAWNDNRLSAKIDDKEYYDYSKSQDLTKFRDEYLDVLLLVGDMGNGAVVVLNPAEKTSDGEWEAWYLSTRLAGALRFRSFAELVQMLYFADVRPENDLWSYTSSELASSCAGKLRFSHR